MRRTPFSAKGQRLRGIGAVLAGVATALLVFVATASHAQRGRPERMEASGALLAPHGLVVTNAHAVRRCAAISVGYANGTVVPGSVVASDEARDIALVETAEQPEGGLILADRAAGFGEPVFAIGFASSNPARIANPLRVERATAGSGAVAVNQALWAVFRGSARPGMSGGPVIDQSGRLVGIIAADYGPDSETTLLVPPHAIMELALAAGRAVSISPVPLDSHRGEDGTAQAYATTEPVARDHVVRVLC